MVKRRKPGFALLEVLVFLLVLLVLVAAILASAGNLHSRSVRRAESDRAYYAALAAVRMLAGDIADGGSAAAFGERDMTLSVEGQGDLAVKVSGTGEQTDAASKLTFLTLTATATVGDETQTVELKMQKLPRDQIVPSALFGMGFAGKLESYGNTEDFTWDLNTDADLCLAASPGDVLAFENIRVGGNLIIHGGGALVLTNSSVGGMIVSDGDVTLNNTVVGEKKASPLEPSKRMSGVCVVGDKKLTLNAGTVLGGPAYAATIEAGDGVAAEGDLYCTHKLLREQTVFSHDGGTRYTSETALGRFGGLAFAGGKTWQTLQPDALDGAKALLDQGPQLFMPNFPANMAGETISGNATRTPSQPSSEGYLFLVKKGKMLTLTAAPADDKGNPAIFVILEEGATLSLQGTGDYFLNVYGQGGLEDHATACTLKGTENAVVCGTLQNLELDLTGNYLAMDNRQPTKLAFQAPASGGRTAEGWAVVDYTQKPAA